VHDANHVMLESTVLIVPNVFQARIVNLTTQERAAYHVQLAYTKTKQAKHFAFHACLAHSTTNQIKPNAKHVHFKPFPTPQNYKPVSTAPQANLQIPKVVFRARHVSLEKLVQIVITAFLVNFVQAPTHKQQFAVTVQKVGHNQSRSKPPVYHVCLVK